MLENYARRAVLRAGRDQDANFARDISQEVLLAIHQKRHTYDPEQPFLPWVFGIARHKLADWQRKSFSEGRWIDVRAEVDDISRPESTPDPQAEGNLQALLRALPAKQREVLELTKLQGLSVAETAARTGLSEANVKVLTHRGMAALKKRLEVRDGQ